MSEQDMKRRIGRLVVEARTELGISRAEFVRRASVANETVRNFEDGATWPHSHTLGKIAQTLGWRQRAIDQLLNSGKTPSEVTLEDVRDATPYGSVKSASDLSDEELLAELTSRMLQKTRTIQQLRAQQPGRDAFDLAAHEDIEPRRIDFEAPSDLGEESQDQNG